ncbi:hypothetical protein O9992_04070 [Vibrio lentus]|nr:hypothetical protein [Vibrio lentus]
MVWTVFYLWPLKWACSQSAIDGSSFCSQGRVLVIDPTAFCLGFLAPPLPGLRVLLMAAEATASGC